MSIPILKRRQDLKRMPEFSNQDKDSSRIDMVFPGRLKSKVRVLVFDDHPKNSETLVRALKDIGAEIEVAKTSVEAVEKTRVKAPDIIFMDMRMMVIGGKEALLAIQEETDQIKIVMMTSGVLDYRREEYIKSGCHYFISKPFHMEAIQECLVRLLGAEFEVRGVKGL